MQNSPEKDVVKGVLVSLTLFFIALAFVQQVLGPWTADLVSFVWPDVLTAEIAYLPALTPIAPGPLLGAILAPVAALGMALGFLRFLRPRAPAE